ncbi:hypothetical protein JTB14_026413 [Gonioctena quinquepunctata]|nr:hypothetical protein JTB14_026413 [Gonioctena quinquepunctata]
MAPKKNYKPEQMAAALGALKRGIHVSAAAKEFNVPRVTLLYKWKEKSPRECSMGQFDRNGGKYSSTVDNRDFETSLSNNKRPAVRHCGVYHKRIKQENLYPWTLKERYFGLNLKNL